MHSLSSQSPLPHKRKHHQMLRAYYEGKKIVDMPNTRDALKNVRALSSSSFGFGRQIVKPAPDIPILKQMRVLSPHTPSTEG